MSDTPVIIAMDRMIKRINEHIVANHTAHDMPSEYITKQRWSVTEGRRYFKAIAGGSAVAFIDKATGDIYKPATWSAPAKHARGNVNSEHNGDEALQYVPNMGMVHVSYLG